MNKTPTTLIIMDGFGLAPAGPENAISCAKTPNLDKLFAECPNTQLQASGLDVGLPAGQMGNSEVGHTNIGAGRVVYQDLPRISNAVEDGSFFENPAYKSAMDECVRTGARLHLMGLLSDGGVHSHINHLFALLEMAKRRGVNVTCETAPHCLAFTQDDLQEDGRFKMNPPLRDQADQDALIEGLLDGTIDMLVTDHAPHSHEEKAKGLEKSAMGVVGLETSFAASYTHLVKKGILPLEKLVELMHTSPMRRFGCGTEIAVGQPADLTVFDLNETYTVDPETFLTMGRATPFTGTQLTGACKLTMIGGEIVWKEDTL